ncbi:MULTISPECIES: hypothetical protein [Pseudomonas]|uniref:hypothetical protein n=1 Tax=Pseudomonas nitroreducens TaxID=46680 RepID=UPI00147B73E8|nr:MULTISPECIES: hypothetical protein [Pseudomonas]NNN24257.1 hypothetical protein [Pseudomonas nitroreducens]
MDGLITAVEDVGTQMALRGARIVADFQLHRAGAVVIRATFPTDWMDFERHGLADQEDAQKAQWNAHAFFLEVRRGLLAEPEPPQSAGHHRNE